MIDCLNLDECKDGCKIPILVLAVLLPNMFTQIMQVLSKNANNQICDKIKHHIVNLYWRLYSTLTAGANSDVKY